MIIFKSYKFRLKPTKEQTAMLKQHGGNVRFVWNKMLDFSNNKYKTTKKFPSQSELQQYILTLKENNKFIKVTHSQPIQFNATKLVRAFGKAFSEEVVKSRNQKIAIAKLEPNEELRKKKLLKAFEFGFPKFKSKNKHRDNIFYPQNVKFAKSRVLFPKLGWINYIKHREILGKQLFSTITQDGKDYYVTVTCELKQKEKQRINLNNANIVGIDVGVKTFATLSDGTEITNPRTLKRYIKKIKRESRKLSRKAYNKETKVPSNNRIKQIGKVQKVHKKVRNIRKDFLHKLTHHITTKYDGVILENLDIEGMLKVNGKAMNRSISDVSWHEFGRILEYKSVWNSKYFCKVNRFFPSTQKCNQCNNKMKLSLKDRVYLCPNCVTVCGRDVNASLNIRDEGMRILNTLATKGIKACGSSTVVGGMKQEQVVDNSAMALAIAV